MLISPIATNGSSPLRERPIDGAGGVKWFTHSITIAPEVNENARLWQFRRLADT
jgi:hypothetical protein